MIRPLNQSPQGLRNQTGAKPVWHLAEICAIITYMPLKHHLKKRKGFRIGDAPLNFRGNRV